METPDAIPLYFSRCNAATIRFAPDAAGDPGMVPFTGSPRRPSAHFATSGLELQIPGAGPANTPTAKPQLAYPEAATPKGFFIKKKLKTA
jgi:hypothetical protein